MENEFFSIARGWNSPASKGRKVLHCFLAFQVSWHRLGHRLDSMTSCPAVSGVLNYMVNDFWMFTFWMSAVPLRPQPYGSSQIFLTICSTEDNCSLVSS